MLARVGRVVLHLTPFSLRGQDLRIGVLLLRTLVRRLCKKFGACIRCAVLILVLGAADRASLMNFVLTRALCRILPAGDSLIITATAKELVDTCQYTLCSRGRVALTFVNSGADRSMLAVPIYFIHDR